MRQFLLTAFFLTASFSFAQTLPTPPSWATLHDHIEQMSGWGYCHSSGCAGGSGRGAYWMALYQSTPSMDGSSVEFFNSGSWANALWWKKLGALNSATNLLWDFYANVSSNTASAAQALEYDSFQFVGGWNYMVGSQCNYAAGVWDLWDERGGHWYHSSIPCHRFAPGTWHHIQWWVTTNHSNHTYTYRTLVVDGVPYAVNRTNSARYLAWSDNVGVQYQLDVNASGQGFHQWVDRSKLYVW
jgi:hypothetical protein